MVTQTKSETICGKYNVKSVQEAHDKNQRPFLKLTVSNKDGHDVFNCFHNIDHVAKICSENEKVVIYGKSNSINGRRLVSVTRVERDESNMLNYHLSDIMDYMDEIHNQHCKFLINSFFENGLYWSKIIKAPASINSHHAFNGGLFVHTLEVMRMGFEMLPLITKQSNLNRDIFLTGLFLHDLGKVYAYDGEDGNYTRSEDNKMFGHLFLGTKVLDEISRCSINFPEEILRNLKHIILSHHSGHLFGAVRPVTPEAIHVNRIESLSLNF